MELDFKEFSQRWVRDVIQAMDEHLEEEARIELLEACGRACARIGPVRAAEACRGDVDRFLAILRRWHGGEELVQREGDVIRVVCDKCLCELVKDAPAGLSGTYCYCSLGWMKEVFGTVVGGPVEVSLLESFRRGDQQCRFEIRY